MKKGLVTIAEYARAYKIDRHTVYKLIDDKTIARRELDGRPYIDLEDKPKGIKRYGSIRKRRVK